MCLSFTERARIRQAHLTVNVLMSLTGVPGRTVGSLEAEHPLCLISARLEVRGLKHLENSVYNIIKTHSCSYIDHHVQRLLLKLFMFVNYWASEITSQMG